jgi:hypothetical protein
MEVIVAGSIDGQPVEEILHDETAKVYRLGDNGDSAAVFGAESGQNWFALGDRVMVHIDGQPVRMSEGAIGQHRVRIGSRTNRVDYVEARVIG